MARAGNEAAGLSGYAGSERRNVCTSDVPTESFPDHPSLDRPQHFSKPGHLHVMRPVFCLPLRAVCRVPCVTPFPAGSACWLQALALEPKFFNANCRWLASKKGRHFQPSTFFHTTMRSLRFKSSSHTSGRWLAWKRRGTSTPPVKDS